jgi:hypothetical protein
VPSAQCGILINEFTFDLKFQQQFFGIFCSAKFLKNMLLLFFCSKKVSKKGALQLEEILHPSSLKAENFKTRRK